MDPVLIAVIGFILLTGGSIVLIILILIIARLFGYKG